VETLTLSLPIDSDSSVPVPRQVADGLRLLIADGELTPGAKLPPSRALAKALGIPRRAVVQAFEILAHDGWVDAGVGRGTFVRSRFETGARSGASLSVNSADASDRFAWDQVIAGRVADDGGMWRTARQGGDQQNWIRFTGATADPALFPTEELRAIVDEVFVRHGSQALDYGPPEGLASLREVLADRLAARGVDVSPEQVLIVNGSQQGLDLLLRLLVVRGETVFVEEPGYANGFRLFRAAGARVVGVPMDESGLSLPRLEEACRRDAGRFLYTVPAFQNPTGICLDEERIEPLLALARRHSLPIIEDHFDGDLVYDGEAPRLVKSFDRHDQVILLGSFSKILFPGLRLGWLVAPPPLLAALRELKGLADFSSGLLAQHALALYCQRGLLDRHLERTRKIYGDRLRAMLDALAREMPPEVSWTRPRGGLTLWLRLPPNVDAWDLLARARAEGVDFSPGPLFFPSGGGREFIRLGFVREPVENIERGIRVLGQLLAAQSLTERAKVPSSPFF